MTKTPIFDKLLTVTKTSREKYKVDPSQENPHYTLQQNLSSKPSWNILRHEAGVKQLVLAPSTFVSHTKVDTFPGKEDISKVHRSKNPSTGPSLLSLGATACYKKDGLFPYV